MLARIVTKFDACVTGILLCKNCKYSRKKFGAREFFTSYCFSLVHPVDMGVDHSVDRGTCPSTFLTWGYVMCFVLPLFRGAFNTLLNFCMILPPIPDSTCVNF